MNTVFLICASQNMYNIRRETELESFSLSHVILLATGYYGW